MTCLERAATSEFGTICRGSQVCAKKPIFSGNPFGCRDFARGPRLTQRARPRSGGLLGAGDAS